MIEPKYKALAERWHKFPNVLDFTVMAIWFFLSQLCVVAVAAACGLDIPDPAATHGADADATLWAQLQTARTLIIIYPATMILAIGGILLYRHLRGGHGRIASLSIEGLNPSLILAGFVWMLAAEIVIEPLLVLMPDTPDMVGRGFFAILVTVILAPLFEEFLCRGILLESFRRKYGVVAAWFCSSLFFAIIHGQITAMVNAMVLGSILGYICIRSRSLLSTVILHAMNNGVALTIISLGYGSTTFAELFSDSRTYDAVYTAAIVICLVGGASVVGRFVKEHRAEKEAAAEVAANAEIAPNDKKTTPAE